MSPEPEKKAAASHCETAAAAAPVPVPFSAGKSSGKVQGPYGPGEPYTPLPDFSQVRRRWKYALAAILAGLAAAAGILYLRGPAAAPASQQAHIEAPAVPGQSK